MRLRHLLYCLTLTGGALLALNVSAPQFALGKTENFLWGVTLSGFQNDGCADSMDWCTTQQSDKVPHHNLKGAAFRENMDEDLDRARWLGLNAFRTSFEWARIEPEPGRIDSSEVAYLHRLLDGIRKRGMTPVIALHHFVTPKWALEPDNEGRMGWENPATVDAYLRYVEFVVREFGGKIDYYLTFNEPSTFLTGGYALGWLAPHHKGPLTLSQAVQNVVKAHSHAYEIIHHLDPVAMVSITEYNAYVPFMNSGFFYTPGTILSWLLEKDRISGVERVKYLDYVALHYYGAVDFATASAFPVEPWRWEVKPELLGTILRSYYDTFKLPIMIAENGLATRDGAPRADGWTREAYLVTHLKEVEEARKKGIPIIGYLHWTLTDNYEWGSYLPRFGLWSVEANSGNFTRKITPAARIYRDIIQHRGKVRPYLEFKYPDPRKHSSIMRSKPKKKQQMSTP